jgi:hypothetical protein
MKALSPPRYNSMQNLGYKSVEEKAQSILKFIKQYNFTAKAFNWKYAG